jgi:hypothetical protein
MFKNLVIGGFASLGGLWLLRRFVKKRASNLVGALFDSYSTSRHVANVFADSVSFLFSFIFDYLSRTIHEFIVIYMLFFNYFIYLFIYLFFY